MELNWELCRIFYQVARCRNFSRAAAMLFTSQPAVSRSMAALERELGCRLFIRNRRGVELTPEGRMFYAHVEAGCEQFRRGREELIEEKTGINTVTAEDPMTAVAIGTGKFVELTAGNGKLIE